MTNPRSATNAWLALKKKLGLTTPKKSASVHKDDGNADDDSENDTPTKASASKRKATAKSPTTPSKKNRKAAGDVKVEEGEDEDQADVGGADERIKKEESADGEDEDAMADEVEA